MEFRSERGALMYRKWVDVPYLYQPFDINMPKVVDHELYRRTLLERSTDVFVTRGYAAISMREIAAAIEVSTGTLYHYFPSKEDLFCHLFLHHARQSSMALVADLCGIESRSQRLERLLRFFERQCDGMRTQFLLSADMVRHDLPPKAQGLLRRWSTALKKKLGELIGIDAGDSELLFCFLSGTLYSRTVSGNQRDLGAAFKKFQKALEWMEVST